LKTVNKDEVFQSNAARTSIIAQESIQSSTSFRRIGRERESEVDARERERERQRGAAQPGGGIKVKEQK